MRLRFCLVNLLIFFFNLIAVCWIFFSIENNWKERIVTVSHFTHNGISLSFQNMFVVWSLSSLFILVRLRWKWLHFSYAVFLGVDLKWQQGNMVGFDLFSSCIHFKLKVLNLFALNSMRLNESKRNVGKRKFVFAADQIDWSYFSFLLHMLFTFYSDRPNEFHILKCLFHLRYNTTASTTVDTYLFVSRDTRIRCRYIIKYEQIIKIVRVKRVCLNKYDFFFLRNFEDK